MARGCTLGEIEDGLLLDGAPHEMRLAGKIDIDLETSVILRIDRGEAFLLQSHQSIAHGGLAETELLLQFDARPGRAGEAGSGPECAHEGIQRSAAQSASCDQGPLRCLAVGKSRSKNDPLFFIDLMLMH